MAGTELGVKFVAHGIQTWANEMDKYELYKQVYSVLYCYAVTGSGGNQTRAAVELNKIRNADMIAQCFGLSAAVISGRASTEEYMAAVRTAVIPVAEEYQAALDRSLLLESEKKDLYFVLDTTELLKGDMTSRFNAYSTALQNNIMSIDEIRYRENLPPLGFNYMKLNLADVLYDPKSGDIITPNTGVIQRTDGSGLTVGGEGGIIEPEVRKKDNYAQDPKTGKMIGSVPMGGGAAGKAKPVRLSKGEYRKIVSEINTNYGKYSGKRYCVHYSLWKDKYYMYKFVNYGFDDYRFTSKERE